MDETQTDLDDIVADARRRHRAGDLSAAAEQYDAVLSRDPNHAEALQLKGILLAQAGSPADGLALLSRAVERAPEDGQARANLAKLRLDLGDIAGAVADYEAALRLRPDDAELEFNLAGALVLAGRRDEAIARLEHARAIAPGHPHVLANLGNLYRQTGRLAESREVLETAAEASPDDPEVQHSLGVTLAALHDYAGAAGRYRAALASDPGFVRAAAQLFYANLHAGDWRDHPKLIANFERLLEADAALLAGFSPLIALHLPVTQERLNRVCDARAAVLRRAVTDTGDVAALPKQKLRVGYLSPDFGSHPVGRLMAGLLPTHDPESFETTAFALSPPDGSDVQQAIHAGVGRVENLYGMSAADAAGRIRDGGIDILVDLGGFTLGAQPEILASRPAPLQIGWLGYCGSSGGLNDVVLADREVLPAPSGFAEAVAHLPGTFMPLNQHDTPAGDAGTRADHGLPDAGFVYCAFNAPAKIDPATFTDWMAVLGRVEGSVLWLREHAELTSRNLRAAARDAGIAPERLVFAPTVPAMADHLARHRHADLFLDTFVYGAHSTAADAIAQGLPVLTCAGAAMPSRVGASLCRAYGIGELVADSPAAYVEQAVALAQDTDRMAGYRAGLAAALETVDSGDAFARKLEDAYRTLWRARDALKPGAIISPEDAA